MRMLTAEQVRQFYDRFGARQDRQAFYESAALATLVAHAELASAERVFELGCGTGRLAQELLSKHLSASARYHGVDVSRTMIALATERLAPFGPRAGVELVRAGEPLPTAAGSIDRFLSTYVLDLLSDEDIAGVLAEAHRVVAPGGLLCLAGITRGTTLASRLVMGGWKWIFERRPAWVGGCRPLLVAGHLRSPHWRIRHRTVVVAWGVASEVAVASRLDGPQPEPAAKQREVE